jgi:hypothetical protein
MAASAVVSMSINVRIVSRRRLVLAGVVSAPAGLGVRRNRGVPHEPAEYWRGGRVFEELSTVQPPWARQAPMRPCKGRKRHRYSSSFSR